MIFSENRCPLFGIMLWRAHHLASLGRSLLSGRGRGLAPTPGPAFLDLLAAATDRERVRRHIAGDDRARAHIGALADLHRRDQRRVRADERVLADLGAVLADAVVVAGDGAGADIGAGADGGVADIAQVIGLGAGLDHRFLDLAEIAYVDV